MRFRSSRICLSCVVSLPFLLLSSFLLLSPFLFVIPEGDLLLPLSLLFLFVIPGGDLLLLLPLLLGTQRFSLGHLSCRQEGLVAQCFSFGSPLGYA